MSMIPASMARTPMMTANGIKASSRVSPQKDFLGHDVERHQNLPLRSVELETYEDGGQIKQATNSLTSSRTGKFQVRPQILNSRNSQNFSQTFRS